MRSQIEAFDQRPSINKDPSELNQQDTPDILKNLYEIMKKDKEKPPAVLKSLRVNYDNKNRWRSPNPLASEKKTWITTPPVKRPTDPSKKCKDCKYKEGLEEVLNILALCGFIKKPKELELRQDSPAVPTNFLIKQGSQRSRLKDLRIKFRGKDGLEHEIYY